MTARYALHELKSVEEPLKNPVTASSAVLVADQNNTAQVALQFGTFDQKVKGPLMLVVDGADVRPDPSIGAATLTSKGVPIRAGSVVILKLGGLTPARHVKITTFDTSGAPPTVVGEPIVFTVDRPVGAIK
jgi:hypothetical protein